MVLAEGDGVSHLMRLVALEGREIIPWAARTDQPLRP
jgi:hypothetical protein